MSSTSTPANVNEDTEDSTKIPESYICPISMQLMREPVMDPTDGTSYERESLIEWIRKHGSSPMTRQPLSEAQVVPNRNLRYSIDEFRAAHPLVVARHEQSLSADNNNDNNSNTNDNNAETTTGAALDRKPLVLFAVIDNSGSMQLSCGEERTRENFSQADSEAESFSRLDMVKHTLNTLITSLSAQDSVCVVKFHTTASVFLPLTRATENNKKMLMERLAHLEPENQTNLWDGVRVALDEIAKYAAEDRASAEKNIQIYLLTDGEPTIHPPKSMQETVTSYMQRKLPAHVKPVINTFGYGYQLDSKLLFSLTKIGNDGAFGFIPDASMVGTVFINALSNSFFAGSSREHVSPLMQEVSAELVRVLNTTCLDDTTDSILKAEALQAFVQSVRERLAALNAAGEAASPREERERAFLADLILDCTPTSDASLGQIAKAIDYGFFKKWGAHYLRSVVTAFTHLVCTNFKDKAMQHFRSARFIEEQSRVEAVFLDLPPPKASIQNYRWDHPNNYQTYGGRNSNNNTPRGMRASAAPAAAPSMGRYYNMSGGCFSAESLVYIVEDGAQKKMRALPFDKLSPGVRVLSAQGETTVETIVKLKYSGDLYALGESLSATPFHPVSLDGKSFFPKDLHALTLTQREKVTLAGGGAFSVTKHAVRDVYVYDVVLANRSLLRMPIVSDGKEVDSVYVATWAQREKKDDVFAHDFFGSEAIVRDLQRHRDYAKGHITIDKPEFVRDEDSLRVVKLLF